MRLSNERYSILLPSFLLLASFLWVTGCSHDDSAPVSPPVTSDPTLNATTSSASLRTLTTLTAKALSSPSVRAAFYQHMRSSTVKERKLHLRSYLNTHKGAILLQSMAEIGRQDRSQILHLLSRVDRQLELYFPVSVHRTQWAGGANLIVASQGEEDETPYGVDLNGNAIDLSLQSPPNVPTLVIVPSESFDDRGSPLPAHLQSANGSAQHAGVPLGSQWMPRFQECQIDECNGGGEVPTGGIFITESYVSDLRESWPRGEPEIEILTFVNDGNDEGDKVRCVGEHLSGDWHFAQNDQYWSGMVKIATQNTLEQLPPDEGAVFFVYEDDDDPCTIKDDDLYDYYVIAGGIYGGLDAIDRGSWVWAALSGLAILFTVGSDDDFIGEIIMDSCTDSRGDPHNSVIIRGSEIDGCATVEAL